MCMLQCFRNTSLDITQFHEMYNSKRKLKGVKSFVTVSIFWKTQLFLKIKEYFPLLKSHIVLILGTVSLPKNC